MCDDVQQTGQEKAEEAAGRIQSFHPLRKNFPFPKTYFRIGNALEYLEYFLCTSLLVYGLFWLLGEASRDTVFEIAGVQILVLFLSRIFHKRSIKGLAHNLIKVKEFLGLDYDDFIYLESDELKVVCKKEIRRRLNYLCTAHLSNSKANINRIIYDAKELERKCKFLIKIGAIDKDDAWEFVQ